MTLRQICRKVERVLWDKELWTVRIDTNEFGCSECGDLASPTVMLGEDPPGYGVQTAWVCRSCLENALRLFDGEATEGDA